MHDRTHREIVVPVVQGGLPPVYVQLHPVAGVVHVDGGLPFPGEHFAPWDEVEVGDAEGLDLEGRGFGADHDKHDDAGEEGEDDEEEHDDAEAPEAAAGGLVSLVVGGGGVVGVPVIRVVGARVVPLVGGRYGGVSLWVRVAHVGWRIGAPGGRGVRVSGGSRLVGF